MKTPTLIAPHSTPTRRLRPSGRLLLLAALTLGCSLLGPVCRAHEPPAARLHTPAPAQNDTDRQLAAKLSSLNSIVRVGVGLFVLGLLSLAHPPLRALVHGVNTRVAMLLGGVVLMVLPTLIVGNELPILGALAVVGGGWYLVRRNHHLSGKKLGRHH